MSSHTTPVDTSILDKMEYEILIQAINGISDVRPHDNNILVAAQKSNELALFAILISVGVAILTICASIYIYRRQENIIREQLKTSNKQNDILLFEKRYYFFKIINDIWSNSSLFEDSHNEIFEKIEPKLTVNYITPYYKLKFGAIISFSRETIGFNIEDYNAKYDIDFYICEKFRKLIMLVGQIRFVFNLDKNEAKELDNLLYILVNIHDEPKENKEECLRNTLVKLERFFKESNLYYCLEKQLYVASNK